MAGGTIFLVLGVCFFSTCSASTNTTIADVFFRKMASAEYDRNTVRAQWKQWVQSGDVSIVCGCDKKEMKGSFFNNPKGQKEQCTLSFPKTSDRTLQEVMSLLSTATLSGFMGQKHHLVSIETSPVTLEFRIAIGTGTQLWLFFYKQNKTKKGKKGWKALSYDDATEAIDSCLGTTPGYDSDAAVKRIRTAHKLIKENYETKLKSMAEWDPSLGLVECQKLAWELMSIIWVAEDCPPQPQQRARWRNMKADWDRKNFQGMDAARIQTEAEKFLRARISGQTGRFPGASADYMERQYDYFNNTENPSFTLLKHELITDMELPFQAKGGVRKQRLVLANEHIGFIVPPARLFSMTSGWRDPPPPHPSQDVSRVYHYLNRRDASFACVYDKHGQLINAIKLRKRNRKDKEKS